MPTLTPEQHYLRTKCGIPPRRTSVTPDPDDPAVRELTTAEAAKAAHVSVDTIRDWVRRTLLVRVEGSPADAPRYRELDVLKVEAATRRTARSGQLLDEAAADLGGR